jgi:hypothetical protein
MIKKIDWNAEEARAKGMSDIQLTYARRDAYAAATLWNDPDTDPDRNNGFYMDQVSVYALEQRRRGLR